MEDVEQVGKYAYELGLVAGAVGERERIAALLEDFLKQIKEK